MADTQKAKKSQYTKDIPDWVRACEAIRRDENHAEDVSLAEYIKENLQLELSDVYHDIGLNPAIDSIQNIINMPSTELRWLIPEIYRDALRLGLRKAPIYPNLIAGEQTVSQTSVKFPAINMADATPRRVNIAETISVGEVSFDQKTVEIHKIGRGIKLPYEVIQYVSLNLVRIFLQDFGVKLGMGLDSLAISTAINGDQANGSDSAPVIGIITPGDLVYRDLLRIWLRGARLGKTFTTQVAGEDMAIEILDLLTTTRVFGNQRATVTMKTALPQNSDLYVHGQIPANQALILDPASSLIKLNAQPLLIETEKIVSNQTEATYATITTGFATLFRDSRIVLDQSLDYATNGFPTWMDPSAFEVVTFD